LNGWTQIAGQFPQAVANDGLFPGFFARESARGTPVPALLVAGAINSLMVLANYSRGMVAMFTFMVLLTTLGNVVCYLFSTMADVVLAQRNGRPVRTRTLLLAFAAFGFCLWAVIGAGKDAVFWNFVLLALGIPLYAWQAKRAKAGAAPVTDAKPPPPPVPET
jgi:APA family basic amino acid/polyamine antiporter